VDSSRNLTDPLVDMPIERIKHIFDTNTFAPIRIAKAVVPFMAKQRSGLIINVGSVVGDIPTPWNGTYCASKAALHSLTEVLEMECRPFNIKVMLLTPGSVKSNISNNEAAVFKLSPDSLYTSYLHNILARLHASQGKGSMSTDAFAREVVSKALRQNPPSHLTLGGQTTIFALLKWLPRAWMLYIMWQTFSKPQPR